MELVKIIKYLDKKFSPKLASEWDKPGLQVFLSKQTIDPSQEINKVLICLDLNQASLNRALDEKVDLIITRHPFLFEELNIEKKNPAKKQMLQKLMTSQILIYSIHTNYDASANQKMPSLLENNFKVKSLNRFGTDKEGYHVKLKNKIKLQEVKAIVKEIFDCQQTNQSLIWNEQALVDEFYLSSGSGGQTMVDAQLENCVFITGELKWNCWIYANDNRVQVLTLGHYMENYFVQHLSEMLQNAFRDLLVVPFNIENQYN